MKNQIVLSLAAFFAAVTLPFAAADVEGGSQSTNPPSQNSRSAGETNLSRSSKASSAAKRAAARRTKAQRGRGKRQAGARLAGAEKIEPVPPVHEYHVSPRGNDNNAGSTSSPLKTISAAAHLAQPGDVITVHEGIYRERINPPRGGTSDKMRITYQAAPGETVEIKGSDVVTGWTRTAHEGVWTVTLPSSFFGAYNPYQDCIKGDWFGAKGRDHHTGEVYLDGAALAEAARFDDVTSTSKKSAPRLWYSQSDETSTTLWADFAQADPNKACVEINMRESCFYPDTPGRNYITVRGFRMSQAATQWAAPTAEQIALIGTHWSKGWIIENNVIHDSKCVGVTLGKDKASGHNGAQSADGYNEVVRRALEAGWSKEKIGSHIVRNNTIYNCGAAGICGSLGCSFSQVTGNHIHHVHLDKPFGGAEMAGIKFHGAIDTLIRNNYIHHTCRGIWLDWMAQGARVSANVLHDNRSEDIFMEVNHGPYVIDNNIFLSKYAVRDMSQGGAFLHNLFAGDFRPSSESRRQTPYHKAHSTEIAGLSEILGGDNRFFNNLVAGGKGLQTYDDTKLPVQAGGNVYLNGAVPCKADARCVRLPEDNPKVELVEKDDGVYLQLTLPRLAQEKANRLITTKRLGKAKIPDLPFVDFDGKPLRVNTDYFARKRNRRNPSAGPFENPGEGELRVKVWPVQAAGSARSK